MEIIRVVGRISGERQSMHTVTVSGAGVKLMSGVRPERRGGEINSFRGLPVRHFPCYKIFNKGFP